MPPVNEFQGAHNFLCFDIGLPYLAHWCLPINIHDPDKTLTFDLKVK